MYECYWPSIPALGRQRQGASLSVRPARSRTAMATLRNPVWKNKTNKKNVSPILHPDHLPRCQETGWVPAG